LRQALSGQHYNVAVVEHFWCAPYAAVLRGHCERMVLDMHNVESVWHERSAEQANGAGAWAHRRFAREAEELERKWIPHYDLVLVTSEPERAYVTNRLASGNVAIVKNTIPQRPLPTVPKRDEVVFSGNMEYAPNQGAARYFAREIWPMVSGRRTKTRWKLVGKSAGTLEAILETPARTTFVPDPEDAMIEIASAAVAVVPLLVGTGTRLKIVEAWAAGTPVVSTTLGAEGLDCLPGMDLLIADGPEAFAQSTLQVLEDPTLAAALAVRGRERYENAYSWESAWRALSALNL
jgi:glycosyltransferase involved in cell wall biosynthesis